MAVTPESASEIAPQVKFSWHTDIILTGPANYVDRFVGALKTRLETYDVIYTDRLIDVDRAREKLRRTPRCLLIVGQQFDAEQMLLGIIRVVRADATAPRISCGIVGLAGFENDIGGGATFFKPEDHPLDFVCLPTTSMPLPVMPMNMKRLPDPVDAPAVVIEKFLGPVDRTVVGFAE